MALTPQSVLLGQYDHLIDTSKAVETLTETLKSKKSNNTFTLDLFCAFLQRRENLLLAKRGNIEYFCSNRSLQRQRLPTPPLSFNGSTVAMRFAWLLERSMEIPWDWWQNIGIHGGLTVISIVNMLTEAKKIGKWPYQLPGCVWGYLLHGVLVGTQYDGAQGGTVVCCDAEAKVSNTINTLAHSIGNTTAAKGMEGNEGMQNDGNSESEQRGQNPTVAAGLGIERSTAEHAHSREDSGKVGPENLLIQGKYKNRSPDDEEKQGVCKRMRLTDVDIRQNTRKNPEYGIQGKLNLHAQSGYAAQSHAGIDISRATSRATTTGGPGTIVQDNTASMSHTTCPTSTRTSVHNATPTSISTTTIRTTATPADSHTVVDTRPLFTPAVATSSCAWHALVSIREQSYGKDINKSCPCRACVASYLVLSGAVIETQWQIRTPSYTGLISTVMSKNEEHAPVLTMMDAIVSQTVAFASEHTWHFTLFRQLMDAVPLSDRRMVHVHARVKDSASSMWYSLIRRYIREGGIVGQWDITEYGNENFQKHIRAWGEALYDMRTRNELNTNVMECISTGVMPMVVCGDVETVAVVTKALTINPVFFAATNQRRGSQWGVSLPNESVVRAALEEEREKEPDKVAYLRYLAKVVAKDWLRREMGVSVPVSKPRSDREAVASTGIDGPTTRRPAPVSRGKTGDEGYLLAHILPNAPVMEVVLEALGEMCGVPATSLLP